MSKPTGAYQNLSGTMATLDGGGFSTPDDVAAEALTTAQNIELILRNHERRIEVLEKKLQERK